MDSLFKYFASSNHLLAALVIIGITLVISFVYALLISIKLRSTKSFFISLVLLSVVTSAIIAVMTIFLTGETSNAMRIVTIAVALGLVRFRSTNGRAEEMVLLFASVAIGLLSGLGYVVVSAIVAIFVAIIYILLAHLKIFEGKRFKGDKLLKITIPESLEYTEVFDDTFKRYLSDYELIEVKTTDLGSLFKLSYKINLKNKFGEKELIDELRTKNGNLEISILPYSGDERNI